MQSTSCGEVIMWKQNGGLNVPFIAGIPFYHGKTVNDSPILPFCRHPLFRYHSKNNLYATAPPINAVTYAEVALMYVMVASKNSRTI